MRQVAGTMVPVRSISIPSVRGYGVFLGGVQMSTMLFWSRNHAAFNEAMNLIDSVQYDWLNSHGLSGSYNSKIAALLLMSNHGMAEKSENKNTHAIGVVRSVYEKADAIEEDDNAIDKYAPEEDKDN